MNERIQELAKQAVNSVSAHFRGTDWQREYEKKFAELIVRECAAVANYRSDGHEVNQFGSKKFLYFTDIGQEILEYFGVEE